MISLKKSSNNRRHERGAILMVMIVLLVVGLTTAIVSSLSYSTLKATRQENSSSSLALAKEALISYAVSDTNRPGELPCPDQDGDGNSNSAPPSCSTFVGYLPWKTLGIPELRDGSGTKLWYALSTNFNVGSNAILNSDTQGQFSISGNTNINNVAAIVIAPGSPLCNHTHSTNNIGDYLESIPNVNATTAVDASPSNDCNSTPYNDQLLAITANQIIQPVEKRIAREAKACLDSYAALSGGKYPWAALVSNSSGRPSVTNTRFGRFPDGINTSAINSSTQDFIDALNDLQVQLNTYSAAEAAGTLTSGIRSDLYDAGDTLKDRADPPPSQIWGSTGNKAEDAGRKARKLAQNPPQDGATVAQVQALIDATQTLLTSNLIAFASDSNFDDCLLLRADGSGLPAPYWNTWRDMLFYQVAVGSTSNPGSCSSCLTIQGGSNTNRAVVVVAGKKLGSNRNPASTSDYLEADNLLPKTDATKPYVTYRPTDAAYLLNNDVVTCLDGKVNCK